MRFLVLADVPQAVEWIRELQRGGLRLAGWWSPQQEVCGLLGGVAPELQQREPPGPRQTGLTALWDAVLVCGVDRSLFTLAREWGQAGVPVMVDTGPAGAESALFELMPLWEANPRLLRPVFTPGVSIQWPRVLELLQSPSCEKLERIELQRIIATDGALAQRTVEQACFQDLYWLLELIKEAPGTSSQSPSAAQRPDRSDLHWEQVTTLQSGTRAGETSRSLVQLTGPAVPETLWQCAPGDTNSWTLVLQGRGFVERISGEVSVEAIRAEMALALAGLQAGAVERDGDSGVLREPSWQDVLRCGQILAAIQQSRQRQRQISIRFEDASGRSQFKTQMSAIGCGVLLWSLFGTIIMLAAAATLDPRDADQKRSEAAGFVFREIDFNAASQLSPDGQVHVQEVQQRWSTSTANVLLAPSDQGAVTDATRRAALLHELRQIDPQLPAERILVRELQGHWFRRLVLLGWVIVFGPLVIFLLAQWLIVAARVRPGH